MSRKYDNAMREYKGFAGPETRKHIESFIPDELSKRLTGREFGMTMNVANTAYHAGRSSHGGLDLIDDCVYIPWANNGDGMLVPVSILAQIKRDGDRYTLDATE